MPLLNRRSLSLVVLTALGATSAWAGPSINLIPPKGARFAVDQRFDIRAEFTPSKGAVVNAQLTLDGTPLNGVLDANNAITLRKIWVCLI